MMAKQLFIVIMNPLPAHTLTINPPVSEYKNCYFEVHNTLFVFTRDVIIIMLCKTKGNKHHQAYFAPTMKQLTFPDPDLTVSDNSCQDLCASDFPLVQFITVEQIFVSPSDVYGFNNYRYY